MLYKVITIRCTAHKNVFKVILKIRQKCWCYDLLHRARYVMLCKGRVHRDYITVLRRQTWRGPAASSWRQEPEGAGCSGIWASDYLRPQLCHPTTDALITHQGHPRHNWVHKVRQLYSTTIYRMLLASDYPFRFASKAKIPSKALVCLNFLEKFMCIDFLT